MNDPRISIAIAGEGAVIVYADGGNLLSSNETICHLVQVINQIADPTVRSLVPAYQSLLVNFDPLVTDQYAIGRLLQRAIDKTLDSIQNEPQAAQELVELPVCYGLGEAIDLQRIAQHNNLAVDEVIELHQQTEYRVFCLGFAPGFAFLGEVSQQIATPRLDSPRKRVPAGAVGIADRQTAVYPQASPGGWNILGLCPATLFDPTCTSPTRCKVGDRVRFKAITEQQYHQYKEDQ